MNDQSPHIPDLRERNMQKRRDRILSEARRMIAELGYDALSTRTLAKAAGVTQPTLYNLIGSKDEIMSALLIESAERIESIILSIEADNPLRGVDVFTQSIVDVFAEDPQYYRAALIAGDRDIAMFANGEEGQAPRSIAAIASRVLLKICEDGIESNDLRGNVSAADLSASLYASLKTNLLDWAHSVISLQTFARRLRSAQFLTMAADASPGLRKRLLTAHRELGPP